MKVVGISFIRNAQKYDYPIEEAIRSILPLCDEVIVAVGNSEDDTRELVSGLDPKVKIIDTIWDDSLREGGRVLAEETNKALAAVPDDADWVVYIQGDEVLHENGHKAIRAAMEKALHDEKVEGLLFNYRHFYGSYDYVGSSPRWYRKEVRVVRAGQRIKSWGDAQGFRAADDSLLKVVQVDAVMHHYGWVKHPKDMQQKQRNFHKMWHDDSWVERHVSASEEFDYSEVDALERFTETHPEVMQGRIDRVNWEFDHDISMNRMGLKYGLKKWFLDKFGWMPGEYKNYRLLR